MGVHVLDLLAARPERVPDQIGAREADAEEIGSVVRAEREPVDQRRGHPRDVRVGERAALPLTVVLGARLAVAVQRVRERRRPAFRRAFAEAVVGVAIVRRRQHPLPGLAVIGVDPVGGHEGAHLRYRRLRVGDRRFPSEIVGEPADRLAAMPREHDGAARLERQGHDVRALAPHLVGERRDRQVGRTCSGVARAPGVGHLASLRIIGAGDDRRAAAIEPGVRDNPVRVRIGAGRYGCVPRARQRRQVRIGGAREPGAFVDQTMKPGRPVAMETFDVVGAHLVDHDEDDQLRRAGLGGGKHDRGCSQDSRGSHCASHRLQL